MDLANQLLGSIGLAKATWNIVGTSRQRRVVNLAMLFQDFVVDYIA